MPRISDRRNSGASAPPAEPQMYAAVIDNDAKSPDDEVWVTVPDFDDGVHRFGPVVWEPVVNDKGIFYPKRNKACLISKPDPTLKIWMPQFEEDEEPDVEAGNSKLLEEEGIGAIIVEGDDDETPRPDGFAHRWWFANKSPKNAIINDVWTKT